MKGFREKLLKVEGRHNFKVKDSYGTKEAWRWIKKNRWLDIGQPITEREFGLIIKAINKTLQDLLLEGKDVVLPNRMGRLEIRKYEAKMELKDNKIVTSLPVDWKRTIDLWEEDEESYKAKTLIRYEGLERFTIYYNKEKAKYTNKGFYKFLPTRVFKKRLREKINNGGFDALLLGKRDELY